MDHVTAKFLSQILGKSIPRITQLKRAGVIPAPTKQGYHLARSVQGFIKFIESRGDGKEKEQERWTRLKADLTELQLKKIEGSLVSTDEVYRETFNKARTVRDALLNIPSRVSSIVAVESDSFKVETILSKEIRQALEALLGEKDAGKRQKSS